MEIENFAEHTMASVWERIVLRTFYGSMVDNGVQRRRYNHELSQFYGEPGIEAIAKASRIRWTGHVERIDGSRHVKKVFDANNNADKRRGWPCKKWIDALLPSQLYISCRLAHAHAVITLFWRVAISHSFTYHIPTPVNPVICQISYRRFFCLQFMS